MLENDNPGVAERTGEGDGETGEARRSKEGRAVSTDTVGDDDQGTVGQGKKENLNFGGPKLTGA